MTQCECGYSVKDQGVYTNAFETDFLRLNDISSDANWEISNYFNAQKPYSLNHQKQNVISNPITGNSSETANGGDPGLQLVVRGPTPINSPVSAAELITKRKDMHYGSYRAAIKYTSEPGTCGSLFWYKSDTQEIDVELLSSQNTDAFNDKPVNFVLHAEGPHDQDNPEVPIQPFDGYHEYRFDWSPDKVSFYTDGQHIEDCTIGVPKLPGRIMFNHWSNGDPNWSKGPPAKDVYMTVAYVKAYFNTTSEDIQSRSTCAAVCEVPDQIGPVDPSQDMTFFTTHGSTPAASPSGSSDGDTSLHVSPDATCGATAGVALLQSIADKAVSQRSAIVILQLAIGGADTLQLDTNRDDSKN
ncbi:MAG: hypothetical protein Q9219_005759 [cf. Caloplaca sp. 3 TL-2023]